MIRFQSQRRGIIKPPGGQLAARNTQCYHGDGVGDHFAGTYTALGAASSSYSITFWAASDVNTYYGVGSEFDNAGNYPWDIEWNTSQLVFWIKNLSGEFSHSTTWGELVAATWYHFTCIRDGGDTKLHVYINGTQSGTGTAFTDGDCTTGASGAKLAWGIRYPGYGNPFDGRLKDCRTFNVALNTTNITLIKNKLYIGLRPSEISGWDLSNAPDTSELTCHNQESPWSNDTVNTAGQIKNTGNLGSANDATGANLAGTTTSGVDTAGPA